MNGAGGFAGLVLAGGRSTRMGGGDKSLLSLGGRRLIDHVLSRLEPQVRRLAISANGDPARFGLPGVPILPATQAGSIRPRARGQPGLEWAGTLPGVRGLVSVATDTPFLPVDLVERLAAARSSETPTVVAASGGRPHPVVALWPLSLAADLRRFLEAGETFKAMRFLEKTGYATASFGATDLPGGSVDPFFNVNTREELAIASRLLGESAT